MWTSIGQPLKAVIAALVIVSAAQVDAHELSRWVNGQLAPAERSEVSVAEVEGKAYVIGDYNGATELLVYDIAANAWDKAASFPYAVHHAAAAAYDGRIYVFGGYVNGWQATSALWMYDPKADKWQRKADMPTPRAAAGAAVVAGKFHLVGGSGSNRLNTSVHEVYEPRTDRWTSAAPIPTPRDHLVVAELDGLVVAVAGRVDGSPSRNLAVTEIYDPSTNRWRKGAALPTPRSGSASAVLRKELYVMGGESGEKVFSEVESYQVEQDAWRTNPPLPTARHGFGAVAANDRIITLVGSPVPGGSKSGVVEILTAGGKQ